MNITDDDKELCVFQKNRRSHEFEHESEPGRMRLEGELGEDDEEMMFVRGASPHPLDEDKDKWDRDGESF